MDCVNKIHEKCFSFLFIEENNVLIDTAGILIHDNNNIIINMLKMYCGLAN